jgi:hypothetical protein
MIHLNEKLRENGQWFLERFIPECYICLTIGDFLRNEEGIMPTTKLLPPAVFEYGASRIRFPSVYFKFKYNGNGDQYENRGYISDLSHALEVKIPSGLGEMPRKKRKSLEDGKRLYTPIILFSRTKNRSGELVRTFDLLSYEDGADWEKSRRSSLQEILDAIGGLTPA